MIEKHGPKLFVIIFCISYMLYGPYFFQYAEDQKWDVSAVYGSVFDLSSVVCAFLFSFLIFVKTTTNKLLDKARNSKSYNLLIKYFYHSICASFLLSVITIPLLVGVPKPKEFCNLSYYLLIPWVMLSAYVLAAVVRSAFNFITVIDLAYGKNIKK